jgi:hypothetical protein
MRGPKLCHQDMGQGVLFAYMGKGHKSVNRVSQLGH